MQDAGLLGEPAAEGLPLGGGLARVSSPSHAVGGWPNAPLQGAHRQQVINTNPQQRCIKIKILKICPRRSYPYRLSVSIRIKKKTISDETDR